MFWFYIFLIIRLFKSYNLYFVGNKVEEYGIGMYYICFVDFFVGCFNICWFFGVYLEFEFFICKFLVGCLLVNNMICGVM